MEDPSTTPDHDFIRPGQVAPDLPAPDNCMACGQPEAVHGAGFAAQAARLDRDLDAALDRLRTQLEYGHVTAREAADLRISLLTNHLAQIHALRVEHFGEGDPVTGWISGTSGTS